MKGYKFQDLESVQRGLEFEVGVDLTMDHLCLGDCMGSGTSKVPRETSQKTCR